MAATLPPARRKRTVWIWLVLGFAGLGMGAVVLSPAGRESIDRGILWAREIMESQGTMGAVVFMLFSALSAMLAFASSAVLVPSANLAWGQPLTFLLLWGGWMLGAVAAYGIGRLAYPLLVRMGYEEKLEEYEQYASQRTRFWMVLLFCLAVPSEIPGYLFGSLRYPFPKFLAAIGLAEAAYALGTVIAGKSLLVDHPFGFLAAIGLLVVVALAAGGLLRLIHGRGTWHFPSIFHGHSDHETR